MRAQCAQPAFTRQGTASGLCYSLQQGLGRYNQTRVLLCIAAGRQWQAETLATSCCDGLGLCNDGYRDSTLLPMLSN